MDTVLDIYDDPTCLVLCRRLQSNGAEMPEKLASAELLPTEVLQKLPDHLFALVATSNGSPLRKYAMHDEAHLATSIAYFIECGSALPEDARTKVAGNLINACEWYEVTPPTELVKVALLEKVARGVHVEYTPAQMSRMDGGSESPKSAWKALEDFIEGKEVTRSLQEEIDRQYPGIATKIADVQGSLNVGTLTSDPRTPPPERKGLAPKVSSHQGCGDVQLRRPEAKTAQATHFALEQSYPIETANQVKVAAAYFEKHVINFNLAERHEFATNVLARATECGVKVAGVINTYGGNSYGDVIDAELERRISAFEGFPVKQASYTTLKEKRAQVSPETMAQALQHIDRTYGLDASYGKPVVGFRDPYQAVYEKIASDTPEVWAWGSMGHRCTGVELNRLAAGRVDLDMVFGIGFNSKFRSDPVAAFNTLTDDQKVVLCRLANQAASS